MAISKQLKACMLASFVYQYNKRWDDNWTIDLCSTCNIVNIFDASGSTYYGGHFLGQLADFCREHFDSSPGVAYTPFGRLDFYI